MKFSIPETSRTTLTLHNTPRSTITTEMGSSKSKEPAKFNPTPTTKSLLKREKSVEAMKTSSSLSLLLSSPSSSSSSSFKKKTRVGDNNTTEEMPKLNKRRSRLSVSLDLYQPSDPTKKTANKLQKRKSTLSIHDLFAKHTSS